MKTSSKKPEKHSESVKIGRPKIYKLPDDMAIDQSILYSGNGHPAIVFRNESIRLGIKIKCKIQNKNQGGNKIYKVTRTK